MAEKKIHVARELLDIAQAICDIELTTAHNPDATHVQWANVDDYEPGLEVVAQLLKPKRPRERPSFVLSAGMIAVVDTTEYMVFVERRKPIDHLDNDPFADGILEDFRQYRPVSLLPGQQIAIR